MLANGANSNNSNNSGGTTRRAKSESINEAIERGGSMVTKLYEFALTGWSNHSYYVPDNNTNKSRRSMGFIANKSSYSTTTSHHHHRRHDSNNRWGTIQSDISPKLIGTSCKSSSSSSTRSISTTKSSSSSSKLSSSRAQNAIALLPTYLLDARSVTRYHPVTAPNGALQLSVAENQLSELPVSGVTGVVECGVDGNDNGDDGSGEEMTLVQVLSQLASSTAARPSERDNGDGTSTPLTFETDMIYYQPTQGSPGLRSTMSNYLHKLLLPTSTTTRTFNPENIILGAGCNAVLENLCITLTEPGDAVLIPTPYYAAFEFDLVARAGCEIVSVNTLEFHEESPPSFVQSNSSSSSGSGSGGKRGTIPPSFYYPNKSSLTHAYNLAMERTSRPPRVLLLSHPNNPLGICYPPEVVRECIEWCREKEVHLISDEIYAGSVYRQVRSGDGGDTFVSAMSLASSSSDGGSSSEGLGLGPYIHLVYALSKDFALSGLRVGVAYTENEEILLPLQKLNDLCQISSQTQLLVERMLSANVVAGSEDTKFVDAYLDSNRANIQARCDKLQDCLNDVDIPHLPADSGLFVWMDFREFLPPLPDSSITEEKMESLPSKEERERGLYLKLMKEYGLLFTPGMSMRNERPGFFRCVFTAASEEEFELGLERIRKFVEEERGGASGGTKEE